MTTAALASAALALPTESRAALAELLLSSLESTELAGQRDQWEREIADRIVAYDRGEMQSLSREQVLRELEEDADA